MNHSLTNLTKGFKLLVVFVIFSVVVISCKSNKNDNTKQPIELYGTWKVKDVSNTQTNKLDSAAKREYILQLKPLLDSSYLKINPDSSYALQLGPDYDKGVWIINNDFNKLVLRSNNNTVSRFIIQLQKNSMRLLNIDTKDSTQLILQRTTLPK